MTGFIHLHKKDPQRTEWFPDELDSTDINRFELHSIGSAFDKLGYVMLALRRGLGPKLHPNELHSAINGLSVLSHEENGTLF